MSDFLRVLHSHPLIAAPLVLLCGAFLIGFVAPWLPLRIKLASMVRQIRALKKKPGADPRQINIADRRLRHLWEEYCETLHLPEATINPRTGVPIGRNYRATVPAEVIFNAQSVFEGRIHAEFFKHLPGLLTGIGIIGTFFGLIDGLGKASFGSDQLNTTLLIASVRDAFYVSASAIVAAMVITFFEKAIVANLHRVVERLCQHVDALYSAGASEEYLSRLVHASEESAAQARILKDALVGELSTILERLTQHQIEASARQQAELRQQIVGAIDHALQQPLNAMAQSFGQFRGQQGEQLAQGLQDSMVAFAAKLDDVLGGQVGQAKELQAQTLQSLQMAVSAFQSMAKEMGAAGETATSSMSSQLDKTLDQLALRQGEVHELVRSMVDEMRGAMSQSQSETSAHVGQLLGELSQQVREAVGSLRSEAASASASTLALTSRVGIRAEETIDGLAQAVRGQSETMQQSTLAMRSAVAEILGAADRTVGRLGEGVTQIQQAAEKFSGSGMAISDVFDRSQSLAQDLTRTASLLSLASQGVQSVVNDYAAARDSIRTLVEVFQGAVETAKRDASLTSNSAAIFTTAAEKLIDAQKRADGYLSELNGVFAEAHAAFTAALLGTVGKTNTEVNKHLGNVTARLVESFEELGHRLEDIAPRPLLPV